jgi:hypothetical protein
LEIIGMRRLFAAIAIPGGYRRRFIVKVGHFIIFRSVSDTHCSGASQIRSQSVEI